MASDGFAEAAARSLAELPGVSRALAADLEAAGFHDLGSLWFRFPLRHEDRSQVRPIGGCQPGQSAQFLVEVEHRELVNRRRRMLLVAVGDGSGRMVLRFFHFRQAQVEQLRPGTRLLIYGEVRAGAWSLEMTHPRYRVLAAGEQPDLDAHPRPIYPKVEGIGPARFAAVVSRALEALPAEGGEGLDHLLPGNWPGLVESIRLLHRPPGAEVVTALAQGEHPARTRLALEELVAQHLSLRLLRRRIQSERAPMLRSSGRLRGQLLGQLPFRLTAAQQRVLAQIDEDLGRGVPMLRLLQGDVGSGKTIVAALAVLAAVESGLQAAVMAPTELLAEQHRRSFERWFGALGLDGVWLSSRVKGRARREALERLASTAHWAVGTHALMQDEVNFRALGLVIIDEQHRFGVDQRLALARKPGAGGKRPHQLVMTATPIPRTLAMTQFADLDVSLIDELPPGRSPVQTVAVSRQRREEVVERIRRACAAGRQAYWVCTLIEESDEVEAEAAEKTAAELAGQLLGMRVGLVHGRLPADARTATMQAFSEGAIDLLVATTVIEVGVDVPNASLMVIENAERLGLAQLHQLRGRVGRGPVESSCVLLYHPPLSEQARERLAVLRDSQDGFRIAERDLALRGAGEVLGTRQTGDASFRVADLRRDVDLLERARALAERLLATDSALAERLAQRWVGAAAHYAKA